MFNKLKYAAYAFIAVVIGVSVLNNKDGGSSAGAATAQLDQALGIATDTINNFESTPDVNENNAMDKFAEKYTAGLNAAQPPINSNAIGGVSQDNGSILSFDDANGNGIQDSDEKDLFMMEVDSENNRLIASSEGESRSGGFSASGLLMGMMIGNMLSRQRATGTNPAARRTTARGTPSAKSRSGSGSHSRGK